MASKVLVKIPTVPFTQVQVNKKGPELIATTSIVNRPPSDHIASPNLLITPNKDPILRVAQLEQNIRFLQEQHQLMLNGLHNEVETLRQRNRDLQFQLVFAKNGVTLSTPSSPEDDFKPKHLSPKQINVTPLQIELLEKELGELKLSLQEANTKNSYLSAIVDEQKKKLENFELEWSEVQPNSGEREGELEQKLEDADRLIRRLRRDHEDQRREITSLRSGTQNDAQPHHHQNGRHNGGNRRGHHRGQRDHRFPPLHSQSYWHQSNGRGGRGQHQSRATDRHGTNGDSHEDHGTMLPSLRAEESTSYSYNNHPNANRRSAGSTGYQGNGNTNNQYHRDGERKYRGQHNRGNKS